MPAAEPAGAGLRATLNRVLRLDPAGTAVVTVDMQRDYLDPGVGTNCLAEPDRVRVLGATARLLGAARALGVPVIHVYVARRPQEVRRGLAKSPYSQMGTRHGLSQNPNATPSPTHGPTHGPTQGPTQGPAPDRLAGSPQAELASVLAGDGGGGEADVHVTSKKTMDGFYGTELDVLLRRAFGVDTLVLAGVNTDTCVLSTAFSATNRGLRVVVAADCTASIRGARRHEEALSLIGGAFAWVLDSAGIARRLATRVDRT